MSEILGIGSRVKHPAFGEGAIVKIDVAAYTVCFMQYGLKHVGKNYSDWEIVEQIEAKEEITLTGAEDALAKIMKLWMGSTETIELGDKWDDGMLILKPGDDNLKSKEMSIDSFFHKIVMVRDRLRVMEQRINSSSMSDEEKVNLQQYITRIYGSLTSFNVLFKYKADHFKGSKS